LGIGFEYGPYSNGVLSSGELRGGSKGVGNVWKGEIKMAVTGYCLKDKMKVEIKDPKQITMKNGKPATTGVCPNCGTKIYKIGKA
jgi:hypothetical protein